MLKLKSKLKYIFEKHRSLKATLGITQLEESYKLRGEERLKYVLDFKVQLQSQTINFHASKHTKEIQNSIYICLDDGTG